jgi:hypothetical protein
MDRNHNHFPTLLTACIIITIMLYVISNVVIFFHERNLKSKQDPNTDDIEGEMTNYLQDINKTRKNSILLTF